MPASFSWPLSTPPAPAGAVPAAPSAAELLTGSVASGTALRGLLLPFRRGAQDFDNGVGERLFASKVQQVIGTACTTGSYLGELPWRSDFGSFVELARHRNNDVVLQELIRQWSIDALARWLPSVRVTDVLLSRRQDQEGQETVLLAIVRWELARAVGLALSGSAEVPLSS
jgi:phage baseplate assembly protein W